MQNVGLDEAQSEIKIAGRNISNLRYADDTTLMAESEEEVKSLLMRVKEESEKTVLKLNTQKLRSCNNNNVCHSFSSKEQASFNFIAAVTIFSDFGTQENKVSHCFHCFPIYLP